MISSSSKTKQELDDIYKSFNKLVKLSKQFRISIDEAWNKSMILHNVVKIDQNLKQRYLNSLQNLKETYVELENLGPRVLTDDLSIYLPQEDIDDKINNKVELLTSSSPQQQSQQQQHHHHQQQQLPSTIEMNYKYEVEEDQEQIQEHEHEQEEQELEEQQQQHETRLKYNDIQKEDVESVEKSTSSLLVRRGPYNIATTEEKKVAVELAQKEGLKEASKALGIPEKNIKRWMQSGLERKKGGGRKTLDPSMETSLAKWIKDQETITGHHLTRAVIKNKARELATVPQFKASKGWLDKFQKRYNITFRPLISEKEEFQNTSSGGGGGGIQDSSIDKEIIYENSP